MYAQNGNDYYAYEYMTTNINLYMLTNICLYRNQLTRPKFILLFVLYFVEKYLCMYPCCLFVIEVHKNKVKNKNKYI